MQYLNKAVKNQTTKTDPLVSLLKSIDPKARRYPLKKTWSPILRQPRRSLNHFVVNDLCDLLNY